MDQIKIDYLREVLNIGKDVAIRYLAETQEDAEEAIELFNNSIYEEKIQIRGRFKGAGNTGKNFSGLFFVILDLTDFNIETLECFATSKKDVFDTDITNSDLSTFKKIVYFYKYETEFEDDVASLKVTDRIITSLKKESIIELNTKYENKKNEITNDFKYQIEYALDDIFNVDVFSQKNVEITVFDNSAENYLEAKLEVDAFEGREVKNLKEGDTVYFHLIDNSEYGKFVSKKLIEETGKKIYSSEILNIKELKRDSYGAQEYYLVVNIVDEINGKIIATGEVKARQIKLINEDEEEKTENIEDSKVKSINKQIEDIEVEDNSEEIKELEENKKNSEKYMLWIFSFIILIIFMLFILLIILGI